MKGDFKIQIAYNPMIDIGRIEIVYDADFGIVNVEKIIESIFPIDCKEERMQTVEDNFYKLEIISSGLKLAEFQEAITKRIAIQDLITNINLN